MAKRRSSVLGPAARPVAVPAGFGDRPVVRASGRVELPPHIRWSGAPLVYDLDDRADLARVYEQVLREGTEKDVLFFIDPEDMLGMWDELVLPAPVRAAWAPWVASRRLAA